MASSTWRPGSAFGTWPTFLRRLLAEYGREDVPFQMVLGGPVTSVDDVRRWEDIGVTRMIVSPWKRSPEAVEAMKRFAEYLTA